MAVATTTDVELQLRRALTPAEIPYAESQIAAYTALLEEDLGRALQVHQFVETYHPIPAPAGVWSAQNGFSALASFLGARVHLRRGPVQTIVSVIGPNGSDLTAVTVPESPDTLLVPTGAPVVVTYRAGDDPPHPLVRNYVAKAVAKDLLVPAAAATGSINSYSVEGTQVNYTVNAGDPNAVGPFSGTDMKALRAGLSRMVLR